MLCRTVFFRRFGGGVRLVMRRRLGYPVGVWVQSPSTHARGGAWHGEARRGQARPGAAGRGKAVAAYGGGA